MKFLMALAGLMGATSVGLGAFTAHGLEKVLQKNGVALDDLPQRLEWATTANQYLMAHAAALLAATAITVHFQGGKLLTGACSLLAFGTVLFCGSLYALAFTGNPLFAKTAPWGGTTLILAWLLLAVGSLLISGKAPATPLGP